MAKNIESPADYIVPLYINGLNGRLLRLPAPKKHKREILFVYGHHSTLERWWGLVQDLNQYGAITMPDLPGFGGMDSFYKIGEKPTLDNLADYLAAFVKMHYKRRRFTIAGLSFGFIVATRMLQRYPDLASKVDMVVSIVGFAHHDDFMFTPTRHRMYLATSRVLSHRLPSIFFKNVCLHPLVLRAAYAKTHNAKHKFKNTSPEEFKRLMNFEVHLWQANDPRTHMYTTTVMLTIDNCHKRVDLPVWHVSVEGEKYFDNNRVEQHLRVIFNDFHSAVSILDNHAPSVIADKEAAAPLIPKKIRQALSRQQ
jgi:pimeloyl-ACP methyl ester carboxylesterase